MGAKLIEALTSRLCSHQFAWPRRRPDGHYYQVCVLCGAEYTYDWSSMTRTGRIDPAMPTQGPSAGPHRARRRSNWVPRARRLRVNLPLEYRQAGSNGWHTGTVENISQSGVLFRADEALTHDTDVDLVFEMPAEITGQPNTRVLCKGYIVRSIRGTASKRSPSLPGIAAAISGYTFLPEKNTAENAPEASPLEKKDSTEKK